MARSNRAKTKSTKRKSQPSYHPWKRREEVYLRRWYGHVTSIDVLTKHLRRTAGSVHNKARKMLLYCDRCGTGVIWKDRETRLLRRFYGHQTSAEVAASISTECGIPRTASAIRSKAYELNLCHSR